MNSKTIKIIIFLISAILILSIIPTTAGCSKLDIEIFGLKFGEKAEAHILKLKILNLPMRRAPAVLRTILKIPQIYLPKTILIQIIRTLTPAISSPTVLIFQN